MKRLLLVFAATLTFHANAQVATSLEVQRLAPQLVAFAGGDANFANLVNGLALGAPVTLSTPLARSRADERRALPTPRRWGAASRTCLQPSLRDLVATRVRPSGS